MDQELERALDAAIDEVRAVRPAPDFLPRLRARIEQTPSRPPIRWWIPFAASASAVAAGVIVAALVRTPRAEPPVAVAVVGPAVSPQAASIAPEASTATRRVESSDPMAGRRVQSVRRVRPRSVDRRIVSGLTPDEIIVPPGQLAALGRLLDAINAGDERAASSLRRLGQDAPIVIAPIRIEPVVVPPLDAGDRGPGLERERM